MPTSRVWRFSWRYSGPRSSLAFAGTPRRKPETPPERRKGQTMQWKTLTLGIALAVQLSGCVSVSGLGTAGCRATLDSRDAHAASLLEPPTDRQDLLTGAQALAEVAAVCGEDQ